MGNQVIKDRPQRQTPGPGEVAAKGEFTSLEAAKGTKGLTFHGVMLEAVLFQSTTATERRAFSQHMLILAQGCKDVDAFLHACRETEKFIRGEAGMAEVRDMLADSDIDPDTIENMVGEVPPSWRQVKNNISRAWEEGLDPKEYKSEGALRTDLNAIRNKRKGRTSTAKASIAKQLPKSKRLLTAVAHLVEALNKLPAKEQDKAAAAVEGMAKDYAALVAKLVPVAPEKPAKAKPKAKAKAQPEREAAAA